MALELLTDDVEREIAETDLPVPNPDPEVAYRIRKLTTEAHRAIVKRHTKLVAERNVGRVEKVDSVAVMDDILDYVLVGWSGVLLKGEPAPCSKALKVQGLDFQRKQALIDLAGMNEIARAPEVRAASFRATA